ncbi:MAG TPA: AraC family transcriptional regulator ligand-binding domain-containing protein [Streptosporangiaceae bacterium]|jgi:AraC-like DNA-binding protein
MSVSEGVPPDPDRPYGTWDFPRSVTGAFVLVRFAAARGVGLPRILRGTGIGARDLADPDTLVEAHQELALIRNLIAELGDPPGLGVETGALYHLTAYGIWGFTLISSATMREALRVGGRFRELTFAFSDVRMACDGLRLTLRISGGTVPADVRRFATERDCAALLAMHRELFGADEVPLHQVRFAGPPPTSTEPYRTFFRAPVAFDADVTELVYDAEFLDRRLPQANEHTAAICAEQCRRLLDQRVRRPHGGTARAVRERLLSRGGVDDGIEATAAALHTTSRTLRRRLVAEGTSYRTLTEEVRRTLADDLLSKGQTLSEVSHRLGYSEPSSFARAYRRWTG